jgi:DNA modification methylase
MRFGIEASRSSRFLGKPNLPNGIIKNDVETILFLRKPGGYRQPSTWQEAKSFIPTNDYAKWFQSVWTDISGQLRSSHPSPFPLEIAGRLIHMFSFVGNTVVDPFAGSRTTAIAALEAGRNSISVDIDPRYVEIMEQRLLNRGILSSQFHGRSIEGILPKWNKAVPWHELCPAQ